MKSISYNSKTTPAHTKASGRRDLPLLWQDQLVLFPGNVLPLMPMGGLRDHELEQIGHQPLEVGVIVTGSNVGTLARVTNKLSLPTGEAGILVRGVSRFRLLKSTRRGDRETATVELVADDPVRKTDRYFATIKALKRAVHRFTRANPALDDELKAALGVSHDPADICNRILPHLNLDVAERCSFLESFDIKERMRRVIQALNHDLDLQNLTDAIDREVQVDLQDSQRRDYLQEQIRVLRRELADLDGQSSEVDEFAAEFDELDLPDDVHDVVDRELDQLTCMSLGTPEYQVTHAYLSWLKDLPWSRTDQAADDSAGDRLPSLQNARRLLNREHYGLQAVKEKILEHLAVHLHTESHKGQILLLSGPPGVGKTSLARSIAKALKRSFAAIALGGVKDEAEIRGHRRAYVGSLPGKIIQGIRKAGTSNPVILLDEIDKAGRERGNGDVEAALLEILDYEQNQRFTDHYLGIPFDLSKVLFIATANDLDEISPPLLDRVQVVELSSYTEGEKLAIARRHLIPKVCRELELSASQMRISDQTLRLILRHYAQEAGVRQLQRDLHAIGRKIVKRVVEERPPVSVTTKSLRKYLGPYRSLPEPKDTMLPPGVAIGLAYTSIGGEILYVETSRSPGGGTGQLVLTGNLGNVMQESVQGALSFLAALPIPGHAGGKPFVRLLKDRIHIHLPDGGTPKDGPSAGIAILAAVASLYLDQPLPADLAMTGEITLRGQVLPVGGIREKVLAAYRYGKTRVLIPVQNEQDLADLPRDVRQRMQLITVSTMDQVLELAGLFQ